jgi:hypothetical protein
LTCGLEQSFLGVKNKRPPVGNQCAEKKRE